MIYIYSYTSPRCLMVLFPSMMVKSDKINILMVQSGELGEKNTTFNIRTCHA